MATIFSNSSNAIAINIKDLPQLNTVQSGDFLIIEAPDGTGIIDFKDFVIDLDQTSFQDTIVSLVNTTVALSAGFNTLSADVYNDVEAQIIGNVAVFKNISPLSGGATFGGQSVRLPLNYIEVNNISSQQSAAPTFTLSGCGDTTLSTATSSMVFKSGTYKTFINTTVGSIDVGTTWLHLNLFQESPPTRLLQSGSSFVATASGQTGHLFIDGYFFLCRDTEISIRADTFGTFKLGPATQNLVTVATASPLSATLLRNLQLSSCNISMYIEKVSDTAIPTINPM